MDFKHLFITLLVLVFLIGFVFADAEVSGLTLTPSYYNSIDHNTYFDLPLDAYVTATGDFNTDSLCWMQIINSAGTEIIAADWNNDTNTCLAAGYTSAQTDDFNFMFYLQNGQGDNNYTSAEGTYFYDETAPTVTPSDYPPSSPTYVDLTCADAATTLGIGSGCQEIYYSLNSGAWVTVAGSSTRVNITSIGTNYLDFCAADNLDNNSCGTDFNEALTKSVTAVTVPISSCGIFSLLPYLIMFGFVIYGIIRMKDGMSKEELVMMFTMFVVIFVIMLVAYTLIGTVCTI